MNKHTSRLFTSIGFSLTLLAATVLLSAALTMAQCSEVVSGLRLPLGITQSNQNNLIVSESGTLGVLHSGRISIVDPDGGRRTLLAGVPSATNDQGDPSGATGVFMQGRTLYVVMGIGDTFVPGGLPNPNPPSSPIFSSLLAIHFSANVEKTTTGFTLTPANRQALASDGQVTLSNGSGKIKIQLIANFPDSTIDPTTPTGFRNVNPFDLVVVDGQAYVTDGGQNLVWQVDIATGTFSALATFPRIPNPLFNPTPPPPSFGGPFLDAVPTGIAYSNGQLLVALFRGFPFPPGASVVEQVDPQTGNHNSFITGLRTAIDVIPLKEGGDLDYLVLQHTSGTTILPPFTGPGLVLRFDTPAGPPTLVANCLTRPTSMTFDSKTGLLYVTEFGGRVVEVVGASASASNSASEKLSAWLRSSLRRLPAPWVFKSYRVR